MTFYAYRLNEYEWWAGENIDQAISQSIAETGISRDEMIDSQYYTGLLEDSEMLIFENSEKLDKIKVSDFLLNFTEPGFAFGVES